MYALLQIQEKYNLKTVKKPCSICYSVSFVGVNASLLMYITMLELVFLLRCVTFQVPHLGTRLSSIRQGGLRKPSWRSSSLWFVWKLIGGMLPHRKPEMYRFSWFFFFCLSFFLSFHNWSAVCYCWWWCYFDALTIYPLLNWCPFQRLLSNWTHWLHMVPNPFCLTSLQHWFTDHS